MLSVTRQTGCLQVGLLHSCGPAVENERSPTVTTHAGRTSKTLEADDGSRVFHIIKAEQRTANTPIKAVPWQ